MDSGRALLAAVAALVDLNGRGSYVHWGFVLVSVANLVVIVVMLALFVLAIALPFMAPRPAVDGHGSSSPPSADRASLGWTGRLREGWLRHLPPAKLLPNSQPAYVASWVYVFGVLTLAALAVVIATGLILALGGVSWWHTSAAGLFVNSLHLWAVELFMGFMAIHLWAKFWMSAWRGRRQFTWMSGVVCFLVAIIEAFTGYLSQTNFDSQWIAFESKDAFNAGGIGAWLNPMDFGQALMLHISLLPLALAAVVGAHILMVRLRGVVPPPGAAEALSAAPSVGAPR